MTDKNSHVNAATQTLTQMMDKDADDRQQSRPWTTMQTTDNDTNGGSALGSMAAAQRQQQQRSGGSGSSAVVGMLVRVSVI
jgi:hypothetical protein